MVYSCSMPNRGAWSPYFSRAATASDRVLVGWGERSLVIRHSHITRMSSPPRIGSGHWNTGCNTTSELSPLACPVLEPSKPQMPGFSPSARILVFDRISAVGTVPSIHMYSALYVTL